MVKHIEHEHDVGLDALDFSFSECSYGLSSGILKGSGKSSYFNQKTVIERCYLGSFKTVTSVKSDAETAR